MFQWVLIDGLQGSAEVLYLHLPGSIYEIHKIAQSGYLLSWLIFVLGTVQTQAWNITAAETCSVHNALGFVATPVVNILLIKFFWRCPGFNWLSWVHGSCCPTSVCIPAVWAWTPWSIRFKRRKEIVNGIRNDHIVVCWHYERNDNTGQTCTCKLRNENMSGIKWYWVRTFEQFSHIKASYAFLCVFSTVNIFTKDSE